MHLDAIKARRTQGGVQVVHGIHLLLWALDVFARDGVRAFANAAHEGELQAVCRRSRDGRVGRCEANRGERPPGLRGRGTYGGPDRPRFRFAVPDDRAALWRCTSSPGDALRSVARANGRIVGQAFLRKPPGRGRGDVPGGVRLARSTPCRRARRHIPVGWHGVPRAAFYLWRPDCRGLRRKTPGGAARLPGGLDRTSVSSGAPRYRGGWPGRLD